MSSEQRIAGRVDSTYHRIGAASIAGPAFSVLAAAFLLTLFAITASLSTSNPRTDTSGFLADVQDHVTLLQVSVWVAAGFSIMIGAFFFALYQNLRSVSEDLMRVSLVAGIVTMIVGGMLVALEAAGAGFIVPEWTAAETAAQKDALFYDFKAVAWGIEATSRMFDLSVVVASIFASLVMLRSGVTWWRAVGWLGIGSGAIHLPSVVLLVLIESFEPVHFVADITFLAWVVATGIGMWRFRSRNVNGKPG